MHCSWISPTKPGGFVNLSRTIQCICWPFYFSLTVTSSSNHLFGCNTDRRGDTDVPPGLVRLPWGEGGGASGLQKFFQPFGPQFGVKIRGGRAPRVPPLDQPLLCLWVNKLLKAWLSLFLSERKPVWPETAIHAAGFIFVRVSRGTEVSKRDDWMPKTGPEKNGFLFPCQEIWCVYEIKVGSLLPGIKRCVF